MRKLITTPSTLALLASFLTVGSVWAQESTTRGFTVGVHLQGSSLSVEGGQQGSENEAGAFHGRSR